MKIELRALEVIRTWRGQKYNTEHESAAELLTLICDAMREQDKITRHACVESLDAQDRYTSGRWIWKEYARQAILNTTEAAQ